MKARDSRRVITAILLVAAAAGIALVALLRERAGREDSVVRIGAILPRTGSAANIGEWCYNGMEVARLEVNSAGGIDGRRFEVVYEDSQNDPKTGISAFRKLVTIEKVPLAVVAMSGVANGVLPVADETGVVLFATVVSLPNFPRRSEWAFRYHISGEHEAQRMAAFAAKQLGDRKELVVMFINDEFGRSTADEFGKAFASNGGRVVASESYEKDAQDFRPTLTRVKALNAPGVYVIGYDKAYALLLKQMGEARFESRLFTNSGLEIPAWRSIVGGAAEGAFYTSPLYNSGQLTTAQRGFVEAYRQRHNQPPPYVAAECYDVVRLVAAAAKGGARESRPLRDALNGLGGMDLAMGAVTVKDRDVIFPLGVMQIKGGQPVLVEH